MKPFIVNVNSGFFDIYDNGKVVRTKSRGNLRQKRLLAGDYVTYDNQGRLEKILPRDNHLIRPPIANIDQAVIIVSVAEPEISFDLIARYILSVEWQEIKLILVFSKTDLVPESLSQAHCLFWQNLGYQALPFSVSDTNTHSALRKIFDDKKSVLVGQSGVGKSSLVNALWPDLNLNTNSISTALGRGKHTTRLVSFFPVESGFIADTPGFSLFDFSKIPENQLAVFYPGFKQYLGQCKFRTCLHKEESGCMIKEVFKEGILLQHYQNYLKLSEECKKWL